MAAKRTPLRRIAALAGAVLLTTLLAAAPVAADSAASTDAASQSQCVVVQGTDQGRGVEWTLLIGGPSQDGSAGGTGDVTVCGIGGSGGGVLPLGIEWTY